ncbi:MAG: hypothetical protein ABL864_12635 [Terricaulis sp.]
MLEYQRTDVMVFGHEHTTAMGSFFEEGGVAGVAGPLTRVFNVVPVKAQRRYGWCDNI